MGSSGASFGNLPGNNAPAPVFGGTNPTGMIPGGYNTKSSYGFPSYNMFGGSPAGGSSGYVTPMANQGIYGTGSSGSGMQGLSSGNGLPYGGADFGLMGELDSAYGEGVGHSIDSILTQGLFNPQVAAAYMNAMQPAYNQGIATQEQAFGAEGARFGSAAALGIGNFASQFDLNEQQTMATMYMQAQQEQLSLLEGILPTMHSEAANGGIWGDIVGGLEMAGGAALDVASVVGAPFTGGMSLMALGAGTSLMAGGANELVQNNNGGGGGGFSSTPQATTNPFGISGMGGTSGVGPYNSGSNNPQDWWSMYPQSYWESASAGQALGGANVPNYSTEETPFI
jgi:hypothetical protein